MIAPSVTRILMQADDCRCDAVCEHPCWLRDGRIEQACRQRHHDACAPLPQPPRVKAQQQLGHARLDVTQRYLVGIDRAEVLAPVIGRRAPVMPLPRLAA